MTQPPLARPTRSIRATWRAVIVLYVSVVVLVGAGAVASTRYQRGAFQATTADFQRRAGALAMLNQQMLLAEQPLRAILYELDDAGPLDQQWETFQRRARQTSQHLDHLQQLYPTSPSLRAVARDWNVVIAGVADAHAMWGSGEVAEALAAGSDPFATTVWGPLTDTEQSLARTTIDAVSEIRERADAAARRQAQLEPILLALIVVALAVSALSASQLSRRIVAPLLALQASIVRIRDGELNDVVRINRSAGREVAQLAASMQEMSRALGDSQSQLREQAYRDGLTGLANRRALTEHLTAAFRDAEATTALLLIDLDDFKDVNDSRGHAAGDELLAAVAGRLLGAARPGDVVARFGGDEFAIVVHATEPGAAAAVLAERILRSLDQPVAIDGAEIAVGCSIGIACLSPDTSDPAALLHDADVAMYMAKSQGKHRVNAFDPAMHASMLDRVRAVTPRPVRAV